MEVEHSGLGGDKVLDKGEEGFEDACLHFGIHFRVRGDYCNNVWKALRLKSAQEGICPFVDLDGA